MNIDIRVTVDTHIKIKKLFLNFRQRYGMSCAEALTEACSMYTKDAPFAKQWLMSGKYKHKNKKNEIKCERFQMHCRQDEDFEIRKVLQKIKGTYSEPRFGLRYTQDLVLFVLELLHFHIKINANYYEDILKKNTYTFRPGRMYMY